MFKRKIVEKEVEKIVYVTRDLTEEELVDKTLELLNNIYKTSVDKKEELEIFEKLADVEGYKEYLMQTMSDDTKRYFSYTTDRERDINRGCFMRTLYFYNLLKKHDLKKPTKTSSSSRKINTISRYDKSQ